MKSFHFRYFNKQINKKEMPSISMPFEYIQYTGWVSSRGIKCTVHIFFDVAVIAVSAWKKKRVEEIEEQKKNLKSRSKVFNHQQQDGNWSFSLSQSYLCGHFGVLHWCCCVSLYVLVLFNASTEQHKIRCFLHEKDRFLLFHIQIRIMTISFQLYFSFILLLVLTSAYFYLFHSRKKRGETKTNT